MDTTGTSERAGNAPARDEQERYLALRAAIARGEVYDDLRPELVAARERAVLASNAYNASFGRPAEEREALLRELVASAGQGAHFEPTFRVEFGDGIHLGERFYANFDCVMLDGAGITIGDEVLFGPRVALYTTNHLLDPVERAAGGCLAAPISIGHRVWLGGGVNVLPGVTIGDGAVIGTGSVVTRDVPAGVVAVGSPARIVREITEADRTGFASVQTR